MPYFERHFTLHEAREELARLRQELPQLQQAIRALAEIQQAVASVVEHASQNGGSPAAGRLFAQQQRVAELVAAITDRGIQIKDPLRGLVDFPSLRSGQEVLLCWLLEEDDILYWHDLETGFGGRRPIEEGP